MIFNALHDPDGKPSSLRVMSYVSLIGSLMFGLIAMWFEWNGKSGDSGIMLCLGFLTSAYSPKVIQRFGEGRDNGICK